MSPANNTKKELPESDKAELLKILRTRFEKHKDRHKGIDWPDVQSRIEASPAKLWSLGEMEQTGGEPDVVGYDSASGEYVFFDCAAESPKGRRSVCYDHQALESRKEHKPKDSAIGMAADMGVTILSEKEYKVLQELGRFDTKTSSWIETPDAIRQLGGAIFGDWRYGTVFIYHNGAESYYAARGFRASLRV